MGEIRSEERTKKITTKTYIRYCFVFFLLLKREKSNCFVILHFLDTLLFRWWLRTFFLFLTFLCNYPFVDSSSTVSIAKRFADSFHSRSIHSQIFIHFYFTPFSFYLLSYTACNFGVFSSSTSNEIIFFGKSGRRNVTEHLFSIRAERKPTSISIVRCIYDSNLKIDAVSARVHILCFLRKLYLL